MAPCGPGSRAKAAALAHGLDGLRPSFRREFSFSTMAWNGHLDALAAADAALCPRRRSAGRFRAAWRGGLSPWRAPLPCATEDRMSFGPWATPARHAGGVGLHGAELAVGFHEEPEAVVGGVQGFGELVRARSEPSMPTASTAMSAFTSTGLPSRVSAPRTMYCPWPSGWMADTRPRMY